MPTPYDILGISPLSSQEDIRAAYKRLRAKVHPDKGGTPDAFQVVQEAYDRLLNISGCPECQNKGFVMIKNGHFRSKQPCPRCWKK